MSLAYIELMASTTNEKFSDPDKDKILTICVLIKSENNFELNVIATNDDFRLDVNEFYPHKMALILKFCDNEEQIIEEFCDLIRKKDIDILAGFEIQKKSIGFLLDRIIKAYGKNSHVFCRNFDSDNRKLLNVLAQFDSKIVCFEKFGRIFLNIWQVCRSELSLRSYTIQNVYFDLFSETFPSLNDQILFANFCKGGFAKSRAISYVAKKCLLSHQILENLFIIERTCEKANIYGITFANVLNRGSQYRVQSMLARISKIGVYQLLSPSRKMTMSQNTPTSIPLVLEPEKGFIKDPIIVLDFRSLYPSIIIAYNLCYSTCLGKLHFDSNFHSKKFGVTSKTNFKKVDKKDLFLTPNKVVFVKHQKRFGLLPALLLELLQTRIGIKEKMKKSDKNLEKLLNARQESFKLISNVIYGYTAAGFSGRMPCSELAESI
ncbi:hypothetical protein MHBO_002289, partial [Bonamia ostreae]